MNLQPVADRLGAMLRGMEVNEMNDRSFAVEMLTPWTALSRAKASQALQYEIPRRLWDRAVDRQTGGAQWAPYSNHPGRTNLLQGQATAMWLTYTRGDKLVRPCAEIVEAIMKETGCSRSTAYNAQPSGFAQCGYTDLCIHCELLRKARLGFLRNLGSDRLENLGQGEVRDLWLKAGGAALLEDEYRGLLTHEDTALRQSACYKAQKHRASEGRCTCCVMDYAANILLRSQRGDAKEFHNLKQVGLFALLVHADGRSYLAAILGNASCAHSTFWTLHDLRQAIELLKRKAGLRLDRNMSLWSDTASGMRSREMFSLLWMDEFKGIEELNYFEEYHGKSECDMCFSVLKRRIIQECVENWDDAGTACLPGILESAFKGDQGLKCFAVWSDYSEQPIRSRWVNRNRLNFKGVTTTLSLKRSALGVVDHVVTDAKTGGKFYSDRDLLPVGASIEDLSVPEAAILDPRELTGPTARFNYKQRTRGAVARG